MRNISILDRALKGDHRKIRHYDILKKRNGEERKGLKDCFYAEVDNKETRWQDSNSEWNNINRTDCSGRTQADKPKFASRKGTSEKSVKWGPINCSFVCMLIQVSPLCLIFTFKFFCFLCMALKKYSPITARA